MNRRLLAAGSLAILGLVLGGMQAFASPGQGPKTVFLVQADQAWQNSGYAVLQGDWVCIAAAGLWSHGYQPSIFPFYGPEGYEKDDPFAIAPTVRIGVLLGRIGADPTPFPIGEELCFVAAVSGDLWFTMNDPLGAFGNNRGTVKVVIGAGDKRLAPSL